ncbi:hypothetical protein CR513_13226, partial [Mucuna pruriens]
MCVNSTIGDFFRHDSFLYKGKRLYVSISSIRQLLVKEAHEGGLMGHFEELKTYKILNEHFFWPHMRKDIHNIFSPHGLYTPLPFPITPWIDISMDFVFGLPREVIRLHGLLRTIVLDRAPSSLDICRGPYGVGLAQSYFFPLLVIHKQMDKPKW